MLRVLGPLVVDGVAIGSARQRRLLAALALRLGASVPVDVLAELVWGADPPADPAGAVQTNVARLRRLLPPELVVQTTPDGYRLTATEVDAAQFEAHVAADRHEQALAVWGGAPFAELDHPVVAPEVTRLYELRGRAVEGWAGTLLGTGRPAEAVA
ncbi:AfsR/SARP family transcriptional regulator, partial [Pseudonocardia pini]|uniref:AfsR/SARP family transcriptional regulator n=1 Tax=Pseudonocardia pini TaxID=2758030 RepID=UPI0015EFF267